MSKDKGSSPDPKDPKPGLHPKNPLRFRYDFPVLMEKFPALKSFVRPNKYGDPSIDFTDPVALKTFNQALLKQHYQVDFWTIPEGFLCPPIPGRADYIHHIADLLSAVTPGNEIPTGPEVRVLDVGVGANCIYPLIGNKTYGWSFVGTDVNHESIESAKQIVRNNKLGDFIEIRKQKAKEYVLSGMTKPAEKFDLSICNPPFHASLEEALSGNKRKWKNLRKSPGQKPQPKLNFGGKAPELWHEGGEKGFVLKLVRESKRIPNTVRWFSSLVSKKSNLPAIYNALEAAQVNKVQTIDMNQGQKVSRIVAWTFQ